MEIKTNYALNQEVWVMSFSRPSVMIVKSVRTESNANGTKRVSYGLIEEGKEKHKLFWQPEEHVSDSKQGLLQSFMKD